MELTSWSEEEMGDEDAPDTGELQGSGMRGLFGGRLLLERWVEACRSGESIRPLSASTTAGREDLLRTFE